MALRGDVGIANPAASMVGTIVVYVSKYGPTGLAAKSIVEEMRGSAMKIGYFQASEYGNGAVAEGFKKQMAAKGVVVNVHHIQEARPKEIPPADCLPDPHSALMTSALAA